MAIKDLKSDLRVVKVADISVGTGAHVNTGAAIDTANAKSVTIALTAVAGSASIVPATDDPTISFTECDTSGGTYTDVDAAKIIADGGSLVLEDPTTYDQTFGLVSTKRYVKPVITTTKNATAQTVSLVAIMENEVKPLGYDQAIGSPDAKP